ncbi:hypothetical protein ACU8V3_11530 [Cobetia marina]
MQAFRRCHVFPHALVGNEPRDHHEGQRRALGLFGEGEAFRVDPRTGQHHGRCRLLQPHAQEQRLVIPVLEEHAACAAIGDAVERPYPAEQPAVVEEGGTQSRDVVGVGDVEQATGKPRVDIGLDGEVEDIAWPELEQRHQQRHQALALTHE